MRERHIGCLPCEPQSPSQVGMEPATQVLALPLAWSGTRGPSARAGAATPERPARVRNALHTRPARRRAGQAPRGEGLPVISTHSDAPLTWAAWSPRGPPSTPVETPTFPPETVSLGSGKHVYSKNASLQLSWLSSPGPGGVRCRLGGGRGPRWGAGPGLVTFQSLHRPPLPTIGRAGCVCVCVWEHGKTQTVRPRLQRHPGLGGTRPLPRLLGPLLTMAYLR